VVLHRTYPTQNCSIARALEVVGERWTLLIVRDALLGMSRFDDFQASLNIATNVLSSRLRTLCDEGILRRQPDAERAGRSEYVLTDKGRELAPTLITLMGWGDRHYAGPAGPPRLTLHSRCRGTVSLALECTSCGEAIGLDGLDLPLAAAE
jgi:DNA-binding HxlR family transcriptional regulator